MVSVSAQLFDLGLQVGDRLFEVEEVRVHRRPSSIGGPGGRAVFHVAPTLRDSAPLVETETASPRPAPQRYWRKTLSLPNWSRNAWIRLSAGSMRHCSPNCSTALASLPL